MRGQAQAPAEEIGGQNSTSARIRKTKHRGGGRNGRPTFFDLPDASLNLCLFRNSDRKGEKIDETFGVLRVVAGHGEAGEARAIERVWRLARRGVHVALIERESDGTGD